MTISRDKYMLNVLAEECSEVAKNASKAIRFGFDSRHPNGGPTNRELIIQEVNDVMAMIWELNDNYDLKFSLNRKAMEAKRAKVSDYYHRMFGGTPPKKVTDFEVFENPDDDPPNPPKEAKMTVPDEPLADAIAERKAA